VAAGFTIFLQTALPIARGGEASRLQSDDLTRRVSMLRQTILASAFAVFGFVSIAASAQSWTPAEAKAKAMLEKVVVALKADKARALVMFTKGEGGFMDHDLYPYCGGPDGYFTAHPTLLGMSLKDLKDKDGKPLGKELYDVAEEGRFFEVSYMWPRPGQTDPVEKVAYVTRIGDQVCAVGYYK
jgi:hypothetical protein